MECENARLGTGDWFTPVSVRADTGDLSMWSSPYDPKAGDTISVFIRSRARTGTLALYRLGWYGGVGGRLVMTQSSLTVGPQPDCTPAFPGPVECPWNVTLRLPLSSRLVDGIYLLKVRSSFGTAAYPFVVRTTRQPAVIGVVGLFTWQAYNAFGGSSLYVKDSSTGRNVPAVSFERPYVGYGGGVYAYARALSNDPQAARWLESVHSDVGYVTDRQIASWDSSQLRRPKVLVMLGHDEYWTWNQRDVIQNMRDQGTHLMFLSGNAGYWNIRLANGALSGRPADRVVCYKSSTDPGSVSSTDVTTRFRDPPLNRPENALYGIMYVSLARRGSVFPLVVSDSDVGVEAQQFLASTGLQPWDSIPGMIQVEGDQIVANGRTPANLQVLFRSPIVGNDSLPHYYHTTFFVAPSGAGVFAAGTNEWGHALDDVVDVSAGTVRIRAVSAAVLQWMLSH
jgi:N,N-dimethylformamidase beta subunit-like, C-terminal